ncbi:16S rRNA (cytosine(1402)-N(4))-methyltransferase RsmH [Mycoplasma phocoenae]|uniref:Ribosomal RNA small subunit methyltransferase H n=1 Tax=Mycoplasma phocoenae TaxID=754517 RepID=A0A858U4B1_9MOLU|nr:16S rRNA (cytosine(1402)-N(4))-methyltransferase RsmH [Mycoplasma phocoenae]QJG67282.1 16S rRNA (cytosine(1402)-N(4))-methyltransferase RsmH [Mycoplasma phocoenae]
MDQLHIPVLLNESIDALEIKQDGIYVDLTLGRAGHSSKILEKLTNGHLYCFDKDMSAIETGRQRLQKINNNFTIIKSDFRYLTDELAEHNVYSVDGILADLGVSSPQLDDAERGFSYSKEAKLDMRMDRDQDFTAYDVVNNYSLEQLNRIFINNADVKLAKRVAKAIVDNRPINTTLELTEVIKNAYPAAILRQKNPCRAIYQAIRIEVNNEFESLQEMLQKSLNLLKVNGKLAIITFHSIEDRIVKNFFKSLRLESETYKLPVQIDEPYKFKKITVSNTEKETNYRARSATLRVLTKLK